jgi:hypothetical protein
MTSKFFLNKLAHCLEPGERIEANNGYVGHADKIKCPNNDCNPEENLAMQAHHTTRPSMLVSNFGGFSDKSTATTF